MKSLASESRVLNAGTLSLFWASLNGGRASDAVEPIGSATMREGAGICEVGKAFGEAPGMGVVVPTTKCLALAGGD